MAAAKQTTDRAKRYRAQKAIDQPGRPRCVYCGAPEPRDKDHVNGDESDNSPDNLVYACRACNTTKGHTFARAGIGVRTRQYNPSGRIRGAGNLAEWLEAVMALKGKSDRFSVSQAIDIVRATPASRRTEFANRIWDIRRARGTDSSPIAQSAHRNERS